MAWGLHRSSAARPQAVGAALRAWLATVVPDAALPADGGAHASALQQLAARPDQALAVDVALPFCASHCLCCERQVHVAQPSAVLDAYVADLVAEMVVLVRTLGPGREVLRLHLGGGTANELSEAQLSLLVDGIEQQAGLPGEALLSADCDPRRTGWLQLRVLRRLGFRRLAFGVLDLDGAVQAAIGRAQSPALVADACQTARDSGIESIELRLMVGLPRQTLDSWRSTLRRLITMAPDRIALCRYHHQPQWAPAQYAIDADSLPDAELCQELVRCAATMLCEAGYEWLGADLFVLETDELALAREQGRLRCSPGGFSATAPLPQLGLGVGALSAIEGGLFWNAAPMQAWCAAVQAGRATVVHGVPADAEGLRRRDAVERLLCQMQLPRPADADGLQPAFERLRAHQADGALIAGPGSVLVTEAGRHRLPELCAAFAAPSRVLQLT